MLDEHLDKIQIDRKKELKPQMEEIVAAAVKDMDNARKFDTKYADGVYDGLAMLVFKIEKIASLMN